jgi:predicted ribosomally synthesized peptide with nif11-like leader
MSEEQLKAFLEAVKADAGLQEKLKAAGDADAVVAIAKEAGFVISVEAVNALNQEKELSDEELEDVAGGGVCVLTLWMIPGKGDWG